MILLVPLVRVVSGIAVAYAALVTALLVLLTAAGFALGPLPSLRLAIGGALVLDVLLVATVHLWWRRVWAKFPVMNSFFFPDLNGLWKMKIYWFSTDAEGVVEAMAEIKQNLLTISMEVQAPSSESETLVALPKKDAESGRPLLYYVFRVIPKQTQASAGLSYEGAAILKFNGGSALRLSGNYFTSHGTRGHYELSR